MCKPTLCLDFDGVLHWYRNGWKGSSVIDDEPVPGAVEMVTKYLDHFEVVIFSSRSHRPGGIQAMMHWMMKYGFPVEEIGFPTTKPSALLMIDDRAFRFEGVFPEPEKLLSMRPWNRRVIEEQPLPRGAGVDVADLVHVDLETRIEGGKRKYGERLTTLNGRDALLDAYHEALDLVVYLRQTLWERDYDE